MTEPETHLETASAVPAPSAERDFVQAQQRLLDRFGVDAESRFVHVPVVGRTHVLTSGDGPSVMMVIGGLIPAAMWTPLIPQLRGFKLHAVDLPGFGMTAPTAYARRALRPLAVRFLEETLDALGLERPPLVGQSTGSLWSTWLALDRPERVSGMLHIGCPAMLLDTSAPLPMRLMSVPWLGRLLTRLQPPSAQQVDRLASMVGEDFAQLPELRGVLLACERLPAYRSSMIGLMSALSGLRGSRRGIAITEAQLRQVQQPTRFIWGEDDPFGPPEAGRRGAALMHDGDFYCLPGGHAPWFRYPDRVGELAAPFLQQIA